jgi:hypothetical protein
MATAYEQTVLTRLSSIETKIDEIRPMVKVHDKIINGNGLPGLAQIVVEIDRKIDTYINEERKNTCFYLESRKQEVDMRRSGDERKKVRLSTVSVMFAGVALATNVIFNVLKALKVI